MSVADILDSHGAWRLALFVLAVALYLLVHTTRVPFLLIARILAALLRGLDQRITTTLTPTPTTAGGHRV